MADIKTKDNAKGTIRTIDKAAVATQRMKQAYIATKEKAERSVNANSSSAEEYASDKLESGIDEVFHDGAYAFDKAGRKGLETTDENAALLTKLLSNPETAALLKALAKTI